MFIDTFNMVAGIVSIVAFVFSVVLYVREKALKANMEAGLIGLIQNLDGLVFISNDEEVDRPAIAAAGKVLRNQAIALLKSFSDREERFHTFDFGFNDQDIKERVRRRKEALGVDVEGCIVEGQAVSLPDKAVVVQDLKEGDVVLSYAIGTRTTAHASISYVRRHQVRNYVRINGKLEVTANHEVFVNGKGWTLASEATVGDELMKTDGGWEMIRSVQLPEESVIAYDIKVANTANLFVSGYLVHNDGKIEGS